MSLEPFNTQAECALLGALTLKPETYWRVKDKINAEDFYFSDHAVAFRLIGEMIERKDHVDPITVFDAYEKAGKTAAEASAILKYASETPGSAMAEAYAEIIAERAELRRLRAVGDKIRRLDAVGKAAEVADAVAKAARPASDGVVGVRQVMRAFAEDLDLRFNQPEQARSVTWGIESLDRMTNGLQSGLLYVLAGRPSMGKTALAIHAMRKAAESGRDSLIFSLEMSAQQLVARMVSSVSRVTTKLLKAPLQMEESDWPRVTSAIAHVGGLPLRFDSTPGIGVDALISRAVQANNAKPLDLIVIDYLQLISLPDRENQVIALGEVSRKLKAMAMAINVPVILVAQLNRDCEKRPDKRPQLSDLRGSGEIEQDADVVIMPYRDQYYNPDSIDAGYCELLVRKQRDGETGTVPALCDLKYGLFEDCDAIPSQQKGATAGRPKPRGWGRSYSGPDD